MNNFAAVFAPLALFTNTKIKHIKTCEYTLNVSEIGTYSSRSTVFLSAGKAARVLAEALLDELSNIILLSTMQEMRDISKRPDVRVGPIASLFVLPSHNPTSFVAAFICYCFALLASNKPVMISFASGHLPSRRVLRIKILPKIQVSPELHRAHILENITIGYECAHRSPKVRTVFHQNGSCIRRSAIVGSGQGTYDFSSGSELLELCPQGTTG